MPPFILALLGSGLRLVANAVLVKGKEFIKEKTGVDVDQATLSDADKLKLRQFQAEHEEELLRLQLEDNKLGLEETKAYLADVADARKTQTAVQVSPEAPWYTKAVQPALAVFIVLATVILFSMFVYWSRSVYQVVDGEKIYVPQLNSTQKDLVIYILGVLSAAVTQVLGYYFGSSEGSAAKSKSIDRAMQQHEVEEAK